MAKPGPVAERLRAYVRARVRKDGEHYEWGNGSRLAEVLQVDSGWVTTYTDTPPTAHATLDQALGICAFYGLNVSELMKGRIKEAPKPDPLAQALTEVVEKWPNDRESLTTFVNLLRRAAGLPSIESKPGRTRGHQR